MPADEVLQIKSAIYDQLSENGRLTDDELEAKRLEFISEETNKDIDSYLSQIGIDIKETEITDVSGWYGENKFNIKASTSIHENQKMQFPGVSGSCFSACGNL